MTREEAIATALAARNDAYNAAKATADDAYDDAHNTYKAEMARISKEYPQ